MKTLALITIILSLCAMAFLPLTPLLFFIHCICISLNLAIIITS